jgi:hypothetical protein
MVDSEAHSSVREIAGCNIPASLISAWVNKRSVLQQQLYCCLAFDTREPAIGCSGGEFILDMAAAAAGGPATAARPQRGGSADQQLRRP